MGPRGAGRWSRIRGAGRRRWGTQGKSEVASRPQEAFSTERGGADLETGVASGCGTSERAVNGSAQRPACGERSGKKRVRGAGEGRQAGGQADVGTVPPESCGGQGARVRKRFGQGICRAEGQSGGTHRVSVPGPRVTGRMETAVARPEGASRICRQVVSQIWALAGVRGAQPGPPQPVTSRHTRTPRQLQKAFQKSRRKCSNAGLA